MINENRFYDMIGSKAYDIKWKYKLEFISNSLLYGFDDFDKINFDINEFISNFKLHLIQKNIFNEEQINELLENIYKDFNLKQEYYLSSMFYSKYPSSKYLCSDSYIEVKNPNQWLECPNCHLKPLVWIFNNGCQTSCGCGDDKYHYFSIKSESINSKYFRTGKTEGNCEEELMNNWNHWVETGEDNFEIQKKKFKEQNIDIF